MDILIILFKISLVCSTIHKQANGKVNHHQCTILDKGLRANCSHKELTEIPSGLPHELTVLDLSANFISVIEGNPFSQYEDLKELYLNNNRIQYVADDGFTGVDNLKILSLSENKLLPTNYSKTVFKNLLNLEELYLHRNLKEPSPLSVSCNEGVQCVYSDTAFQWLQNLRVLSIDLCGKSKFGPGFLQLKKLQTLTFDYCLACELKNETFENFRLSDITQLNLKRCMQYRQLTTIDNGILKPFPKVRKLDLSNSYFSLKHALELLFPFQNKDMDIINFHRVSRSSRDSPENPFKITLTSAMMKYLKTICVKTLILSYNGIVDVTPNSLFTFNHPECFENLIFSANSISLHYNQLYMEVLKLATFATNLKLLDYSYVPLQYADMKFILPPHMQIPKADTFCSYPYQLTSNSRGNTNMTFPLPPKIESIRLSHVMSYSSLFSLIIRNTNNLKILDLSYFQFQTFPEIYMPDGNNVQYIDMSGIDSRLYLNNRIIQLMANAETVILRDANLDMSFRQGGNIFKYFTNNTKKLDISRNHLVTLPTSFSSLINLQYLNLSFNSFVQFPKALLRIKNLKTLDMRYNQLFTIDYQTRKWIDHLPEKNLSLSLLLTGNEVSCTCEHRQFVTWLYTTKVHLDSNRIYPCHLSNGTRTSTKVVYLQFHNLFSHCDAVVWLRIGVICIVSAFVLIGSCAIIYQFRWRITYFFYRQIKTSYFECSGELNFTYDVFVAYAYDCSEWLIETLIPTLETEWNLSVCVKDRDFPVGADLADTIISCIQNSKYIIFIITPGFIKRKWGRFEIEMAKYEMFEQRKEKKIIVVMKDGTTQEDVPPEFSFIWRNITMINWPPDYLSNDNSWYKLKLHLDLI